MIWIVGAGPAGISAALYALRAGEQTGILYEPGGGSLLRAGRIENCYAAGPVDGKTLMQRGLEQAEALGAQLVPAQVLALGYGQSGMELISSAGVHPAQAVILATGAPRLAPQIPGLARLEGMGVSYCAVCDGFFSRGRQAAVLGSGSFACYEAAALLPLAAGVTLLTNGQPVPKDLPEGVAVQTGPVRALHGEQQLEGIELDDGTILQITRLFVALGTAGSTDLARQAGAVLNGNAVAVDASMATNVPGLFAAGDCTGGWMQIVKAAHEGAVAGLQAAKYCREHAQST